MRKLVALVLAIAIQAAGLTAPLVHAHPDALATDHSAHPVHSHWVAHHHHESSPVPVVGPVDHERAVFLNAFVAVSVPAGTPAAVTVGFAALPVPPVQAAHRIIEITHAHDPPDARSLPARAPPTFLS